MPAWLPAAIAGGASLLGQFMGSRQQNRNVNKTNRANLRLANLRYDRDKEMAEYAYDKDLEMWNLQNQYNSPMAQMQRFEEAGLNKHMIYGQGTPGNATGMPSYSPPSYQPPAQDFMGTQSTAGNVLGQFTGASKDAIELQQMDENLKRAQHETNISKWNSQIRSMDIPGANLKYLIDKETTEQLANLPESEWQTLIKDRITSTLSSDQQKLLGQKLRNR